MSCFSKLKSSLLYFSLQFKGGLKLTVTVDASPQEEGRFRDVPSIIQVETDIVQRPEVLRVDPQGIQVKLNSLTVLLLIPSNAGE